MICYESDIKLEDEDKAMMLLTSLSASYEHLVTTLLYGKETLELEEVLGALLDTTNENIRIQLRVLVKG